jgi:hypothetical protein
MQVHLTPLMRMQQMLAPLQTTVRRRHGWTSARREVSGSARMSFEAIWLMFWVNINISFHASFLLLNYINNHHFTDEVLFVPF